MKGTLYWFTGLSGAGKSTIAQAVYKKLKKKSPNLVLLDGDSMRAALNLTSKNYDTESRKKIGITYSKISELLTNQGIDVIFATVAMYDEIRLRNRQRINKYIEIYVKVPIDILIARDKKNLYSKFQTNKVNNVVGMDIKFEEPKNPDIVLNNNGQTSPKELADIVITKINVLKKKANL